MIVVISFLALRGANEKLPEHANSARPLQALKLRPHTTAGSARVSATATDALQHLPDTEAPVPARDYAEILPADDVAQPV